MMILLIIVGATLFFLGLVLGFVGASTWRSAAKEWEATAKKWERNALDAAKLNTRMLKMLKKRGGFDGTG